MHLLEASVFPVDQVLTLDLTTPAASGTTHQAILTDTLLKVLPEFLSTTEGFVGEVTLDVMQVKFL
jgi:hypothetical protein